mmetsp:Transcript_30059/g.75513  ORF Transcript_30059/g.75513 Transcript_30059/m.75513 type:complete len:295 (-) Transcript_30059:692-1576(-)
MQYSPRAFPPSDRECGPRRSSGWALRSTHRAQTPRARWPRWPRSSPCSVRSGSRSHSRSARCERPRPPSRAPPASPPTRTTTVSRWVHCSPACAICARSLVRSTRTRTCRKQRRRRWTKSWRRPSPRPRRRLSCPRRPSTRAETGWSARCAWSSCTCPPPCRVGTSSAAPASRVHSTRPSTRRPGARCAGMTWAPSWPSSTCARARRRGGRGRCMRTARCSWPSAASSNRCWPSTSRPRRPRARRRCVRARQRRTTDPMRTRSARARPRCPSSSARSGCRPCAASCMSSSRGIG